MSTEQNTPTPEDIREMSEDELEAFKREQKQRLDSAIHEEQQDLNEQEQAAVDILSSDATDRAGQEAVDIGDATLFVTTQISGRLEKKFTHISKNRDDLDDARNVLIDAILELVEDDDENGAVNFQSREVWEAIHDKHGTTYLGEVFAELAEPALDRMEQVESFR